MKAKRKLGTGIWGGAVVATLAVVACGDGFAGGEDCKTNRTCAPVGGTSAGERGDTAVGDSAGGPEQPAAGSDSGENPGTGGDPAGGIPSGGAGAVPAVSCQSAEECSNGKDDDGDELCVKGVCRPGNAPPQIVSVLPADQGVAIEPDTSVVVEFSEPIDSKTVTSASFQLLDGETPVHGVLSFPGGKVKFTPDAPLALVSPYTLNITTGISDEEGAALLSDFSSTFTIRDGSWHEIDAVVGRIATLSDVLPITATGSVLLAWAGSDGSGCPASAQWFSKNQGSQVATFTAADETTCGHLTSAANADGIGAVLWTEDSNAYGTEVQQYRGGTWQRQPTLVSKNLNSYNTRVVVSPKSNQVTFFEHSYTSNSWTTTASGAWVADPKLLGSYHYQSRTSAVFDALGNGLAVWKAQDATSLKDSIVASRFAVDGGQWGEAIDLPGSVATSTSEPLTPQRGAPALAIDSKGDALALWVNNAWVNESGTGKLYSSRFVHGVGWQSSPVLVSGSLVVGVGSEAPALVFDGSDYVAAWTATEGSSPYTYTARYDLETGWGAFQRVQTGAGDGVSANKMPRLSTDGGGNLMLVFAKGPRPFSLMSRRFTGGSWGAITPVPDSTIPNAFFEEDNVLPLSGNASGLAALAWGVSDGERITTIHLASFY